MSSGSEIGFGSSVTLRAILATVILGSGLVLYLKYGFNNEAFYLSVIIAVVYLLSLTYLLFNPLFNNYPRLFKITQITFDLILASLVVYITGGSKSPFVFLYALIIIFSSIIYSRTGSLITAAISGILYVLIIIYKFQYENSLDISGLIIKDKNFLGENHILETYFNLTGFLMVAILSGYLSDRYIVAGKELGESRKSLSILRNLHENILQSLTSGVITLNKQGGVISINKRGYEILGLNGKLGSNLDGINQIFPGINVEDLTNAEKDHILYHRPDGRNLTLGFSSSVLRDAEGEYQGHVIIFKDVTEIMELENRLRSSEKMALLGQLSAGLAHEIRNPLSAMSGVIEVLSEEITPSEENNRLVAVASQEVERLNFLVEDFLVLTSPIQTVSTFVDIDNVINESVESFLRSKNGDSVEIEINNDKGIYVMADSYRLKQAFWNLLQNSMEAMPNGGKVQIESHMNGDEIMVKFSDNGCGIDEKIINKIFDPFFTTKKVGTGLGLAIVQKVIEGYNGKLNVISSLNNGTTFVISFPNTEQSVKDNSPLI